jgi:hypothetical protein
MQTGCLEEGVQLLSLESCAVAASAEVHSRSFDDNLALGYLGSLTFRSVREVYVVDHLPPKM